VNGVPNGLFLKFLIGVTSALSISGVAGTVVMYRELGVVKASMRTEVQVSESLRAITERVAKNEERLIEIDKARNERTSWGPRLERIERIVERLERPERR